MVVDGNRRRNHDESAKPLVLIAFQFAESEVNHMDGQVTNHQALVNDQPLDTMVLLQYRFAHFVRQFLQASPDQLVQHQMDSRATNLEGTHAHSASQDCPMSHD